ncbi:hypothetical protein [Snodgrassella communis]|uniref:hypothetical protein n=1 Tax=Snodgrassella communis TaxID=2946699 RepID=UPI000C1E0006|nr:hypothetical protein [Snodgrassella communis]
MAKWRVLSPFLSADDVLNVFLLSGGECQTGKLECADYSRPRALLIYVKHSGLVYSCRKESGSIVC